LTDLLWLSGKREVAMFPSDRGNLAAFFTVHLVRIEVIPDIPCVGVNKNLVSKPRPVAASDCVMIHATFVLNTLIKQYMFMVFFSFLFFSFFLPSFSLILLALSQRQGAKKKKTRLLFSTLMSVCSH
jgi:quinol-cytochrome oxidoreductase complex cytochrome b subunit